MKIYIIGSLRNPDIPTIGRRIRALGHDVFDDWHAAGPEADDYWQAYEKSRGHTFAQALKGRAAQNVLQFDRNHLDSSDAVLLVMPAGKSGHLEFGYAVGKGKRGVILLPEEPDRFDVMYGFAEAVVNTVDQVVELFS